MSKFRMKLKLSNLEVEIEGAREDASLISRNVGQQVAQLLRPIENIAEGQHQRPDLRVVGSSTIEPLAGRTRRRRPNGASAENDGDVAAVDFKHQPEKFGTPKQDWKTAEKAIWLLYVLSESTGMTEVGSRTIVTTFNKHFKQSGTIKTGNVNRDLGRFKAKEKPALVGEDTTKSPSTWFLTDEGRKRAQTLVAEALGQIN